MTEKKITAIFKMTSCLKMTVLFDWDYFSKRSLTDSKWVTRVPESRILFLVHSSSSAFFKFHMSHMTLSCDHSEWSVGDNLSISVWNHTQCGTLRKRSTAMSVATYTVWKLYISIDQLRTGRSQVVQSRRSVKMDVSKDKSHLPSDILLIWPGMFGVTTDL